MRIMGDTFGAGPISIELVDSWTTNIPGSFGGYDQLCITGDTFEADSVLNISVTWGGFDYCHDQHGRFLGSLRLSRGRFQGSSSLSRVRATTLPDMHFGLC